MNATFRNFALSATLIAVPAAGFALAEMMISPAAQTTAATQSPGLGDLSAYKTIVADTQTIAATGDLKAAEHRITDLETLWDQNASALRQADRAAWNTVDAAADEAFSALRAGTPTNDGRCRACCPVHHARCPCASNSLGPIQYVSGIPVTDEGGRAIPART